MYCTAFVLQELKKNPAVTRHIKKRQRVRGQGHNMVRGRRIELLLKRWQRLVLPLN